MWKELLFSSVGIAAAFAANAAEFKLESPDFSNGGVIPLRFTLLPGGTNETPQLKWSNPPANARSFVISCIDYAPIARRWVHWIIVDIPPTATSIGSGHIPQNARELENQFGRRGYGGPRPPKGSGVHDYVFKIYALDIPQLKFNKNFISESELEQLIKNHVIATAVLTGKCEYK